jgi:hypothetical protein
MAVPPIVTFVTTTSYGSWLPGDARGYVERGQLLLASPELERFSQQIMSGEAVVFSNAERERLFAAFVSACAEFNYLPLDLTIEAWHLHWIVRHDDRVMSMVGRLKNRMRQSLGRGRIWTEGYSHSVLQGDDDLLATRDYIRKHPGCRLSDGRPFTRQATNGEPFGKDEEPPGGAGG